ncbi:hypothetical protein BCU68_08890 [Vibrio sp. 10N.286.49.B3]|nr:hypothetical protein BCU68_08890 [Vibrio sp. 10N.286.49.B3]
MLNVDELQKLNKVLSQRVMQLPPSQYSFDIKQLRNMLNGESSEKLSLSGLKLSLEELIPQHVQKTEQELVEEIDDVNKQITELKQILEVSRESEAAERKKSELNTAVKQCEQDLRDYEQLQQFKKDQAQRNEKRQTFEIQLVAINTALENADKKYNELAQQIGEITEKLSLLFGDDRRVEKLKKQKIDDQALFNSLSEQPHTPWIIVDEWSLEYLPARLEQYIEDC